MHMVQKRSFKKYQ